MLVHGEERVTVQIQGVFDAAAAQALASRLDDAGGAEVRIDLTRVREFHDFGVAVLARTIARRRFPTEVVGLHEHHLRLIRYLGIDGGGANLRAGVELN